MNINSTTLSEFENIRKSNNYIPPEGSNSFYNVGNGKINIFTEKKGDYTLFSLFITSGTVDTGDEFLLRNPDENNKVVYKTISVFPGAKLHINRLLTIDNSYMNVYGELFMDGDSVLKLIGEPHVELHNDSIFTFYDNSSILSNSNSDYIVEISGEINIDLRLMGYLTKHFVHAYPISKLNVRGISQGNRCTSITDYEKTLRDKTINPHTQGENNFEYGRLGYVWNGGSVDDKSQIIKIVTLYGESIFGDFKFSVLGIPEKPISNKQIVSDIIVKKGSTLHITESFKGYKYIRPILHIGSMYFTESKSIIADKDYSNTGKLIIDGNVIVDGKNSSIILDTLGEIYINEGGILQLKNQSILYIAMGPHDKHKSLYINGTLIIDSIEQIRSFREVNIVFGKKGKVIILNPETSDRKVLLDLPKGLYKSDLYNLFKANMDRVEYHVSNNTGIMIDDYHNENGNEPMYWFHKTIYDAIHEGLLVWHDGGFVELDNDVVPWSTIDCTLLDAQKLLPSLKHNKIDRLQDIAEKLSSVGCGDIVFRFKQGDEFKDVKMTLKGIKMKNVINKPLSNGYTLITDNSGELFIADKVPDTSSRYIVSEKSKQIHLNEGKTDFQL